MKANAGSRRLVRSNITGRVAIQGKGNANRSRESGQAGSIPPDRSGRMGPDDNGVAERPGLSRVIGVFLGISSQGQFACLQGC